jgi:hypothetical protein
LFVVIGGAAILAALVLRGSGTAAVRATDERARERNARDGANPDVGLSDSAATERFTIREGEWEPSFTLQLDPAEAH